MAQVYVIIMEFLKETRFWASKALVCVWPGPVVGSSRHRPLTENSLLSSSFAAQVQKLKLACSKSVLQLQCSTTDGSLSAAPCYDAV